MKKIFCFLLFIVLLCNFYVINMHNSAELFEENLEGLDDGEILKKSMSDETDFLFIDFNDISDANYFDAYYSVDGETSQKVDFNSYWEIKDGKLISKTDSGFSTLILKDYGLISYEMSVDYTPYTDGYLSLVSKVRKKGLSSRGTAASQYKEYGHGVFVTNDGIAYMQGDFRSMGLNDDKGIVTQRVSNYDNSIEHNLRLECYNDNYLLSLDDENLIEYVGCGGTGFMGLQAVNSKGSFDNFTLKMLDINGNYKDLNTKDDVIKVAAIGDSLTYGSSDGFYDESITTPGQLQTLLGDGYDVRNFGLGGRTAIEGSGSCIMNDAEFELALKYKADIMYIMLGTNDSQTTGGYWGNDDESGAILFKEGYQKIINKLLEANSEAVIYLVVSPTYRHTGLSFLTEDMINRRARVYTRVIAEENDLKVIDANEVTKAISTDHLFDYIHFDSYGYGLIAEAIYNQLALDSTEELTLPYGDNDLNKLLLRMGDNYVLKQTSRTNPRYSIINNSIATIDEKTGLIKAKAAGSTQIIVKLGTQEKKVLLRVKNDFNYPVVSINKPVCEYGDELPILNVECSVSGSIQYESATELEMGTKDYSWVFVPSDHKYEAERGTVTITCNKANPEFTIPTINNIELNEYMKLSDIELPNNYTWKNESQAVSEGLNEETIIYTPSDIEHYNEVEIPVTFRAYTVGSDESVFKPIIYVIIGCTFGFSITYLGIKLFRIKNKNL